LWTAEGEVSLIVGTSRQRAIDEARFVAEGLTTRS